MLDLIDFNQPQISVMHQRRRLQCVIERLPCHLLSRQPPQLVIDQRQQLLRSPAIAAFDVRKDSGYVAHEVQHTARREAIPSVEKPRPERASGNSWYGSQANLPKSSRSPLALRDPPLYRAKTVYPRNANGGPSQQTFVQAGWGFSIGGRGICQKRTQHVAIEHSGKSGKHSTLTRKSSSPSR
jgi:hypothetical protein